jgi:hypothetical protein
LENKKNDSPEMARNCAFVRFRGSGRNRLIGKLG